MILIAPVFYFMCIIMRIFLERSCIYLRLPGPPSSDHGRHHLPVQRDALPMVAPLASPAGRAVGPRQQVGPAAVEIVGGAPENGTGGLKLGKSEFAFHVFLYLPGL